MVKGCPLVHQDRRASLFKFKSYNDEGFNFIRNNRYLTPYFFRILISCGVILSVHRTNPRSVG